MTTEDRFHAKVTVQPSGCWDWTAARNKDGYGSFWSGLYRGGDRRNGPVMVLAHRWAYEHFVGEVPGALNVLHKCDNPSCVNPDHLFVGTQADNVDDCAAKGRRNQTRYVRLSAAQHAEIRARYGTTGPPRGQTSRGRQGVSQSQLAEEFGVSQATISHIIRRAP